MSDPLRASLDESVAEGLLEIVDERDGEPLYRLTQKGHAHVEAILDDALEQAVSILTERLDIPRYMARDMLLHRAQALRELDS